MKVLTSLAVLMISCLLLNSCGSKTYTFPTQTTGSGSGSVPSGSTSISLYTPQIQAGMGWQGTGTNSAQVIILTGTTSPAPTNATVTLTGPSGFSMPLTYNSFGSSTYETYYNSITGWTYAADQNYTMTISYGGYTYQSTVTSLGNVSFTPGSAGLTLTWIGGGNENTVMAIGTSQEYWGPNLTSPYYVAQASLPGYTPGSYDIELTAENMVEPSAFSGGAYIGSFFSASYQVSYMY